MTSRKKHVWILVIAIIILGILILFKPSYGWQLRAFLSQNNNAFGTNDQNLAAENETLKAELAKLQVIVSQLPTEPPSVIRAMVYTRYPLNFRNEFLVNAGSGEGVIQGKAVLFQGVLVGIVEKVFADSALVKTIFDPSIKMPVRIGGHGYDALLIGGDYPKASSILKTAAIQSGDIIYAADPTLPYGLPIGEVLTTSTSPDNLFEEATLSFAYDLGGIETVFIQT